MASAYAQALGAGLAIVAKQRKSATETEALYLIGEVEERDVLLVDDLTETAGTLTSAAELMPKTRRQEGLCRGVPCRSGGCRDSAFAKVENRGINYHEQHACARRWKGLRPPCFASPSCSGRG